MPAQQSHPSQIEMITHQSERRRSSQPGPSQAGVGCCCSCCCSCCLHTIGGITGAIIGGRGAEADIDIDLSKGRYVERIENEWSPVEVYWICVGLLTMLLSLIAIAVFNLAGLFLILLGFPIIQLCSSLLAWIVIAFSSDEHFPDRSRALTRLGKVTWYSFFWALVGLFPSIFLFIWISNA